MATIDIVALITIAFFGSVGHCTGMCGGFVVAYTSSKIEPTWRKVYQAVAHLLYNIGRVTSYTIMGAVFGFLGSIVSVTMAIKGWLFLFIGLIMVLMGFSLMGKVKFMTYLESSIAQTPFFKTIFQKLFGSQTLISFYLLGVLNGFIPCGFVYFFLAGAVATASPLDGAILMFLFGIATIPILFLIGFVVSLLESGKFRKRMVQISGILVILFGLWTIFKASMLISGHKPMKGMGVSINSIVKQEQ